MSDNRDVFKEAFMSPTNVCGGFHACVNRTFEHDLEDCEECKEDAMTATIGVLFGVVKEMERRSNE
jgi:hypothetical protein